MGTPAPLRCPGLSYWLSPVSEARCGTVPIFSPLRGSAQYHIFSSVWFCSVLAFLHCVVLVSADLLSAAHKGGSVTAVSQGRLWSLPSQGERILIWSWAFELFWLFLILKELHNAVIMNLTQNTVLHQYSSCSLPGELVQGLRSEFYTCRKYSPLKTSNNVCLRVFSG